MATLPTGTVTFLFSDIEGSTKLLERLGDEYLAVRDAHNRLLREIWVRHDGVEMGTEGDSFFVVFARPSDAVEAAVAGQRALAEHPWPSGAEIRVRAGIHTGEARLVDGDYVGMPVNQAARIASAGHGGQILLSAATRALVGSLPPGTHIEDLGQHRLKDLEPLRIYQLTLEELEHDFPPIRSLEALPNNIPAQLTSFVGRESELAELVKLLEGTRLLTLTGPGGCGKTRLALHLGADVLDRYADGVWVVDLAVVVDPDLVAQAIASALGLREKAERSFLDVVLDHLAGKEMLLILDNCEHLVRACGEIATDLLMSAPRLTILATTREALGVAGETAWRVPSLSLPEPASAATTDLGSYEAVQLFVQRARQAEPSFDLVPSDASSVIQVITRLDGIPLAIELAAAWVKALSVAQIAARLDDQFRMLTGGSRTALERQQTLRASVDWSYALLEERERALLRRLSVFVGSFPLEAAEAACAGDGADDVLGMMLRLVDKSLVVADKAGGAARYRLLETIRQYAREKLHDAGEGATYRTRHRDCYLAIAEEAARVSVGPQQLEWYDRLELEHDNLRAALEWTLSEPGGGPIAVRLAAALWRFWEWRGHWTEGRRWVEDALAHHDGTCSVARAQAVLGAGALAEALDEESDTLARFGEAVTVARDSGDRATLAEALRRHGTFLYVRDREAARGLLEESVETLRALGDRRGIAEATTLVAQLMMAERDPQARSWFEQALLLTREIGDARRTAQILARFGMAAFLRGDSPAALRHLDEAASVAAEAGDRMTEQHVALIRGWYHWRRGEYEDARAVWERQRAELAELGERRTRAGALISIGWADWAIGDLTAARKALEDGLREDLAISGTSEPMEGGLGRFALIALGYVARAEGRRDEAKRWLERAKDATGLHEDRAAVLDGMGWIAADEGAFDEARALHREALRLWRRMPRADGVQSLEGLAYVEPPERAAVLLCAAAGARERFTLPISPVMRPDRDRAVERARAALGEAAYEEGFARGRELGFEEAIAYALEEAPGGSAA